MISYEEAEARVKCWPENEIVTFPDCSLIKSRLFIDVIMRDSNQNHIYVRKLAPSDSVNVGVFLTKPSVFPVRARCECGAASLGYNTHSHYCPLAES